MQVQRPCGWQGSIIQIPFQWTNSTTSKLLGKSAGLFLTLSLTKLPGIYFVLGTYPGNCILTESIWPYCKGSIGQVNIYISRYKFNLNLIMSGTAVMLLCKWHLSMPSTGSAKRYQSQKLTYIFLNIHNLQLLTPLHICFQRVMDYCNRSNAIAPVIYLHFYCSAISTLPCFLKTHSGSTVPQLNASPCALCNVGMPSWAA